jgi:hypothetical protein
VAIFNVDTFDVVFLKVAIFNGRSTICEDVFIASYLGIRLGMRNVDMDNLADIPADDRTGPRIGMDVDLHYGLSGPSFCIAANQRGYIAAWAVVESTNDGPAEMWEPKCWSKVGTENVETDWWLTSLLSARWREETGV